MVNSCLEERCEKQLRFGKINGFSNFCNSEKPTCFYYFTLRKYATPRGDLHPCLSPNNNQKYNKK